MNIRLGEQLEQKSEVNSQDAVFHCLRVTIDQVSHRRGGSDFTFPDVTLVGLIDLRSLAICLLVAPYGDNVMNALPFLPEIVGFKLELAQQAIGWGKSNRSLQ